MQYKLRRFISVLILIVTVFNGIGLTSPKAYAAPTPSQVQDAINKFVDAVGKFLAKDASDNIGKIADFCNRLGGMQSLTSGIIGILQMTGVIKDPVLETLGKILNAVKDVQTTLNRMNQKLNDIVEILIQIETAQQEIARNEKATEMSISWNDFNTNYTEKLETYLSEYQAMINAGIAEWWNQASHEGVYVLMTKAYYYDNSLTYSKQEYKAGFPEKSDISGDIVERRWSLNITSNYIPKTHEIPFNVNTYRDDFKKMMIPNLERAMDDGAVREYGYAIEADYYRSTLPQHRKILLEACADNILNTIIYKIACKVISDNNIWVTQVISTYIQYCDNILKRDSGVNAFLNYIFLTHSFEGEVKNDIERFCDGMIAQAGFYGQLALTCAGQDSLQTIETKEKIRDYFVNTVRSLSERKSKAITGHQNYCYITGTILKADALDIQADIYIRRGNDHKAYYGCTVNSWSVTFPSKQIIDNIYMSMIYKHYANFPNGAEDFNHYLDKYGAMADSSYKFRYKNYLTKYNGVETFQLNEGIPMKAHRYGDGGSDFIDGGMYNIDVGTGVYQEYYHVHDKLIGDLFDATNGSPSLNTIFVARAFYGRDRWWTHDDEIWLFARDESKIVAYKGAHDGDIEVCIYKNDIAVIGSEVLHDLSGDAVNDPNNPFAAFDQVSLTPGVSDFQGILYENTSKDITDVLLESESFTYTGQPIEPAVMVLCSDDIVSEDGYTVTYINNDIESGDAVVRVEGKGEYSGIITRHFRINSASDSDSPINYSTGSSGGCNSISGLGLALGLVFVFKKLRRR